MVTVSMSDVLTRELIKAAVVEHVVGLKNLGGAVKDTTFTEDLGAFLEGAKLEQIDFSNCVFNGNFSGSELDSVVFADCTFVGVSFNEAKIRSTVFLNCKFDRCSFMSTDMSSTITNCVFEECAVFPDLDASNLDVKSTSFTRCSMSSDLMSELDSEADAENTFE